MKRGMVVLAAILLAGVAMAEPMSWATYAPAAQAVTPQRDTLGNVYDGVQTYGSAAQDFEAAYNAYDVWVVSDFTTSINYYLDGVVAEGFCNAAADGTGANFVIYNGLPWSGGSVVLTATGGYDTLNTTGTFGADFGHAELAAGSYYMVFQAVRDYATSGQSYVYQTATGNNNDYQWNPGQGFGFLWTAITNQGGSPIDINWQLSATAVPEPASLLLIGLSLLLRRR